MPVSLSHLHKQNKAITLRSALYSSNVIASAPKDVFAALRFYKSAQEGVA